MTGRGFTLVLLFVALAEAVALVKINSDSAPTRPNPTLSCADKAPGVQKELQDMGYRLARMEDALEDVRGRRTMWRVAEAKVAPQDSRVSPEREQSDSGFSLHKLREAELEPAYQRAGAILQSFNYYNYRPEDVDHLMRAIDAVPDSDLQRMLLRQFALRVNSGG